MISYNLLDRFYKNECSSEERKEVIAYLSGTDHTLLDEFLKDKWKQAEMSPSEPVIPPPIRIPVKPGRRNVLVYLKYAAIVTGILVAGSIVYQLARTIKSSALLATNAARQWNELNNRDNSVKMVVMQDGTKVWLNRNAKLRYPADYNKNTRELELTGEAYFEVMKDDDRPFKVHTGKMVTTALGTSFNISSFMTKDTAIKVSLLEGKVAVALKDNDGEGTTRLLAPGMAVTFEDNTLYEAVSDNNIRNVTAWMKDKLYFDSTSLKDVCRHLSAYYDVDIAVEGAERTQRITGVFNTKDSLKSTIHAISFIHHLHVTYSPENGYLIKK